MFDLILGVNTLSKLGNVLDFNTVNITIDEFNLPMRETNKLSNKSKIERTWSVNNSMHHEPQNTLDVTKHVIKILDANFAKADLQLVVKDNCSYLSLPEQTRFLSWYTR